MLQLKKIVKDYEAGGSVVHALKGVSLSFRESEFVAILGPSGCGKTTLLNIIGGLDRYTSGDLVINGRSTKDFSDRDWDTYRNHSIGFVFQSYNLIPHQTVLQNVELALTLSGVSPAERKKRAAEVLRKVGLGDQLDKKPNQMSGGQMQRVAIARALVNDPDILLADEPTGALDSETSVQIMEILKEISREKLIIMVTHNPDLAQTYATRTIRLLDGEVTGDSLPFNAEDEKPRAATKARKPSMSFKTALSLSLTNLLTKKGRTILTAFAGSIGIIGIALILSLSNGIQKYIDDVQEDTLASYPLTIDAEAIDLGTMMQTFAQLGEDDGSHTHSDGRVYANPMMGEMMNSLASMDTQVNNLTAFKAYLEDESNGIRQYISAIQYGYDMGFAVYTLDPDGYVIKADAAEMMEGIMESMYGGDFSSYFSMNSQFFTGFNVWQELVPGSNGESVNTAVTEQYDVLYGAWPKNYDEVVLVVDQNNEISDLTLFALGLQSQREMASAMLSSMSGNQVDNEERSWSYEQLCSMRFKVILPSERYQLDEATGTYRDLSDDPIAMSMLYNSPDVGITLKIVGIVRPGDRANAASNSYIGYTSALTRFAIDRASQQDIIAKQIEHPDIDVFTGEPFPAVFLADDSKPLEEQVDAYLASLSDDTRHSVLVDAQATPSNARVDQLMEQSDVSLDRESILTAALEMADPADHQRITDMINAMDDETLKNYATVTMREAIRQQFKEQARQIYQAMNLADLEELPLTSEQYEYIYTTYIDTEDAVNSYELNLKKLGYVQPDHPSRINIYAKAFADKDMIAEGIAKYNAGVSEDDQITYTDYVALLMSSITTIINAISYVLIAFVAISLVVSSIMIGIITYISVLERTKEIGILRSIGASKKDISRVFNAETLIEGFTAGVIGILVALLLLIPINLIVHHLTGIPNLSAQLPVLGGIILVLISMGLTFIAGLIPSRYAANKDPVVALRTE